MKSQWKRLVFASIISSSIFAVTWFWYKSTENRITFYGSEKPLAYVGKSFEDIQRRPAARLLWQSVNTGEALYNGEAIRTSAKGEVRVQFADSDRYLDLEPDSLIVIKKAQGEIALDLMEGSLFVNAKNGSGSDDGGLVLNSANGKVDLSGASASLSKSNGSEVGFQVLDGTASILGRDGRSQSITTGNRGIVGFGGMQLTKSNLEIISPTPQKSIFMDPDDIKPVTFKWKGFPEQSFVTLYIGPTRKDLKAIETTSTSTLSELHAKSPLGRHFWKLVATDAHGKVLEESPIYRSEILARFGPTIISPLAEATLLTANPLFDLTFKWQKDKEIRQVSVEVWADKELKTNLTSQTFQKDDSFILPNLKEGTYFWRISCLFTDSEKPMIGKIQRFAIRRNVRLPVILSWTKPLPHQYYIEKPILGLSWDANQTVEIAKYRVSYHLEGADSKTATRLEIVEKDLKTPVEKPGRYIASIEALDKDGESLGSPIEKLVSIEPFPRLIAPKFQPETGILQAANDGRAELKWQAVQGAKQYELSISQNGKILKKSNYTKNSTSLKGLPPGEHQLQIFSIDEFGRSSEKPEIRNLIVPEYSGVKAPTLKKVTVD